MSDTPKHTPGPWEVYLTEDRAHPYILQDDPHRPQKVVAIIFDDDSNTSPYNAALVAAAPDLLAALIDAVSQMQANMPPAKYRKNDHAALWRHATFIRDLENARRAIAKATTEK